MTRTKLLLACLAQVLLQACISTTSVPVAKLETKRADPAKKKPIAGAPATLLEELPFPVPATAAL